MPQSDDRITDQEVESIADATLRASIRQGDHVANHVAAATNAIHDDMMWTTSTEEVLARMRAANVVVQPQGIVPTPEQIERWRRLAHEAARSGVPTPPAPPQAGDIWTDEHGVTYARTHLRDIPMADNTMPRQIRIRDSVRQFAEQMQRGEGLHYRNQAAAFDEPPPAPVTPSANADIVDAEVPIYVPPELDWDEAPEWANWYAVDANGRAFFYDVQPTQMGNMWVAAPDRNHDCEPDGELPNMAERPHWRTMIYQRPTTVREQIHARQSRQSQEDSMPVPPPPPQTPLRLPTRHVSWSMFISQFGDHPTYHFCNRRVAAHLIPGADSVTVYIKLTPQLSEVAKTLIDAGVTFPGIGWDRTLVAFVSEVQHPEIQIETVFLWCKFLGTICAGQPATPPPGVVYGPARTLYDRMLAG